MVMKSYNKTIFRSLKENISRFISISAIILVGICFVTGVGGITSKIEKSFSENLNRYNASDFIIKSKNESGFINKELNDIKKLDDIKYVSEISMIDKKENNEATRIYYYSFDENKINKIKLVKGHLPDNNNEIVVEKDSNTLKKHKLNEEIKIFGLDYKIVGVVENPIMFYKDGDESITTGESLKTIVYINSDLIQLPLPKTDILVKLKSSDNINMFTDRYQDSIKEKKKELKSIDSLSNSVILTLNENKSFALIDSLCEKIDIIAAIFPLFFIFVVSLVVLTTISRFVDEERNVIGCFKSLGYLNKLIIIKYLVFSFMCLVIGISIGLISGSLILPNLIYPAFDIVFYLPKETSALEFTLGIITSIVMFIVVMVITFYSAFQVTREKPTSLLTYKTPKAGKKIFLEHIKFIWNNLSFKYKSSFRNIFRYIGRLLMIVISMCGCSTLVFAGFGLKDVSGGNIEFKGIVVDTGGTIALIAGAVIAFALLLSVLVLYNLTNMNIGERKRELATLKVLGYTNKEVNLYIFREIMIMSFIGILLGVPGGLCLLQIIFKMLEFGSISGITIFSYLYTVLLLILFIIIVDLLLSKKINDIDMNDALKTLE